MTDGLQSLLKQLRLSGLLSTLEVRLHEAAANHLDHREFLGWVGLKILAVILLGTITVMGVTAFTVDLCCRWTSGHEAGHGAAGHALE